MTNKRILITGATGLIGSAIAEKFDQGARVMLTARSHPDEHRHPFHPFDLTNLSDLDRFLDSLNPEVIIHTAAMGSINDAELNKVEASRINTDVPAKIAEWCAERNARMLHFSTDFVFDGTRLDWNERDAVAPLSWYGKTKAESERMVKSKLKNHVIIRPILVYGTSAMKRRLNLPLLVMAKLSDQQSMQITSDQLRMPTYVVDIADACVRLVDHDFTGTLHLSGPEVMDMYAFARLTAQVFDLDDKLLKPIVTNHANQAGQRPMKSGFDLKLAKEAIAYAPLSPEQALRKMHETLSK